MNLKQYNQIFVTMFEVSEDELNSNLTLALCRGGILWPIWS